MLPGLYIGTSGWNYASWRNSFYEGVPRKDWLRHVTARFTGLEINATFYRLQERRTFERWRDAARPGFRFAIKGNRFLTHNRKLVDPVPSIRLERDRARVLGRKLAVVLWQLPRSFRRDLPRLIEFARALGRWRAVRHAIEFRHPSWFSDEVAECLRARGIAVCQSDAADWPLWEAVTTDLVYVRLHGHTRTYVSSYSRQSLAIWARRIRRWRLQGHEVHVYFDNDAEGAAPKNAAQLLALVAARGSRHRAQA